MQYTSFKFFACCCLLLSLIACTSQETSTNKSVGETTSETENTSQTANTTQIANDNRLLPAALNQYLATQMPDWRLVTETEWLMPDFLEFYAQSIDEPIAYETSVFIEADLDGNDYPDYAALLIDGDRQTALWAFHGMGDNNFKPYQLSETITIKDCCVGKGLERIAPNSFTDLNDETFTIVEISHDGIAAITYSKTSTIHYFDGTAYQSILTSD